MSSTSRNGRTAVALAAVVCTTTLAAMSAAGDRPSSQGTRRCYASDGGCYPSPATYGYYPTHWRRWPGEPTAPAPKKAEPESITAPLPEEQTAPARSGADRTTRPGTALPDAGDKPPTPPSDFEIPEFPDEPKRRPSGSPFELDTPDFDVPSGPGKLPLNPLKPTLEDDPFKDEAQLEPPTTGEADARGDVRPSKRPVAPQVQRSLHWGVGQEARGHSVRPASAADGAASTPPPPAEGRAPAPRRDSTPQGGAAAENPLRRAGTLVAAPADEDEPSTAALRSNPLRSR